MAEKEKLVNLILRSELEAEKKGIFNCSRSEYKAEIVADFLLQNGVSVIPIKHGEWHSWEIEQQISYDVIRPYRYYSCSICNRRSAIRSNYCPNCGAKMDRGENNG